MRRSSLQTSRTSRECRGCESSAIERRGPLSNRAKARFCESHLRTLSRYSCPPLNGESMRTRIRVALAAGRGAVALGVGLPTDTMRGLSPVLRAQAARCDRQCLADIMTRYLNAVVAHDTKSLPLSDK